MPTSTVENIYRYLDSLLYTTTRPQFAAMIANSVDPCSLSKADTEAKLLTLGALLSTGKLDVFSELIAQLNFNEIPQDDRSILVAQIFALFSESLSVNMSASSALADALMQLLVTIYPEPILAHERCRGPFPQPSLIKLDYAQKISESVSGTVFFREFMHGPGSRKHEFGYRIKTALASQNWNVSLLPWQEMLHYSSTRISDFALIDLGGFFIKPTFEGVRDIFSNLKQFFRKIIVIDADPWVGTHNEMLLALSDQVDYIWGFTSDWSMTKDPIFRDRSILFPNVGGFDHLDKRERPPLDWNTCKFNFTGSVQSYNLNRIYWILESIRRNLPIAIHVTNPGDDDGLDHEQSLRLYAQSLTSTHASLNFTTRRDGSRILTGRAVEVISLNRLLIQEKCPAFNQYYVEGEHFLEFSDIEGLSTIIEFLRAHPRVAQKVGSQGYQFYQETYSSLKLVEHIQTFL